jgi:hypothetical protein
MTGLIQKFSGKLATATVLAVTAFAPAATQADDDGRYGDRYGRDYRYGDERRYDRDRGDRYSGHRHHDRDETKVKVDINLGGRPRYEERRIRNWVPPVYRTVTERVWVEPVHQTVTERVWVAPVYKTVYEEIEAPARYEVRETVRYRHGRRYVTRERILVEPACTRRIARNVCVSEGRWDVIEKRVCVSEGHWDTVERQVCVSEGRWDYRVERVEVSDRSYLGVRF